MNTPEQAAAFEKRDRFARHLGISLCEMQDGRAVATMSVGEEHTNGLGMVHGGALFSLADLAFAAASNSKGRVAVAINATISYIEAPQTDSLTAVAEEVSAGRKLATYSVTVSDGSERICAVFQGTAYLKQQGSSHGG